MLRRNLPPFKLLAIASLTALVMLCGCRRKMTNVERGNRDHELYIGIGAEPEALDPHIITGMTESYVLLSLFEGLTTRDPKTLEIRPGAAESWDISEDGCRYTFHLDPDGRWSNGDPLVAGDFLFSFERMLSPELGAPNAYMLHPMRGAEAFNKGTIKDFSQVGVQAPDDDTLIIELNAPTPYFLGLLTHYSWWPVHPPTILKYGRMTDRTSDWTKPENYVGNGPFILEKWRLNDSIVVKKNPRYHGAESVWLNRIHFLPLEIDPEERAFRAGYIHVSNTVPIPRIDWYREHQPNRMRFDTFLGTYYYAFNTTRAPFADPRVRQALSYAINREDLVRYVLKAGQKPAYNFTPPDTAGYTCKTQFSYDPERARQLLAEAGFPGGKGFPKFELLYNTSESQQAVALAIQQMWKTELGIDISLYNQEWKVYLSSRKAGEFDVMRASWIGDYDDPSTFLNLLVTGGGNNHSRWSNPEYDQIMRLSNTTRDPEQRKAYFQQAEAIALEAMPIMPIYFYVRSLLIDESVEGWWPNVLDYHPYQEIRLVPNP